jgi:DMSO reductase family type II enzyme heme b subunit
MPAEDRWHVANYVMTLRDQAVPLSLGDTVLRGVRIEGDLPSDPGDPAWEQAKPITFPLVPNVIKEPRLFFSLNDAVTARVLFNDHALAIRLDVDDRSYSVPGDPLEAQYRHDEIEPAPDALAVQFPSEIPTTSEKPWFRHGDAKHPVNMWYWRAPSIEPEAPETTLLLDARGPDGPPTPRDDSAALSGAGAWEHGQWRVVLSRSIETDDGRDVQLETGRYIPIAFANWDGWAGQQGGQHTLTSWYWLLLEQEASPVALYGITGTSGLAAGLLFIAAVRSQRRRRESERS